MLFPNCATMENLWVSHVLPVSFHSPGLLLHPFQRAHVHAHLHICTNPGYAGSRVRQRWSPQGRGWWAQEKPNSRKGRAQGQQPEPLSPGLSTRDRGKEWPARNPHGGQAQDCSYFRNFKKASLYAQYFLSPMARTLSLWTRDKAFQSIIWDKRLTWESEHTRDANNIWPFLTEA